MSDIQSNPLGMSDEDFLNMAEPEYSGTEAPSKDGALGAEEEAANTVDVVAKQEEPPVNEPKTEVDDGGEQDSEIEGDAPKAVATDEAGTGEEEGYKPKEEGADVPAKGKEEAPQPEPKAEDIKKEGEQPKSDGPVPVNYEEFFKQVMAPFKANGKTINLNSPEEVIQLMQMGANYTKKLQDIQPHRKMLIMLQNNDLLDEGKLSYLIDLDRKDPEAIKKLIKDANIDPLDIDMESAPAYQEGSHRVSDSEAAFITTLEELNSTQEGKDTLQVINDTWDKSSKDMLWDHPEVMNVIQGQRANGVYDLITTEMERQKLLGKIAPTTSFLDAYKTVGDFLASQNAFDSLDQGTAKKVEPTPTPVGQQERVIVDTRVAAPKSKVENGDKASAASPTRSTPRKAQEPVNFLAMPDDEFMSKYQGRL